VCVCVCVWCVVCVGVCGCVWVCVVCGVWCVVCVDCCSTTTVTNAVNTIYFLCYLYLHMKEWRWIQDNSANNRGRKVSKQHLYQFLWNLHPHTHTHTHTHTLCLLDPLTNFYYLNYFNFVFYDFFLNMFEK